MHNEAFEITLTDAESALIRQAFSHIPYMPNGNEEYITALRVAAYSSIPERILKILERQRSSNNPLPYVIFNNLPIDEAIYGSPTFSDKGTDFKSANLSENVITAFGSVVGEPYSIYFEGQELVNNLTPQKDCKRDYTGLGSDVELDFHIENAALKFMSEDDYSPMGIFFLGLRVDPNSTSPKTRISDARLALSRLSKEDLKILCENNFIIRVPYRWRGAFAGEKANTELCPLVSGPADFPRISAVFYPDMVKPVGDRAKEAFMNFYDAIKFVSVSTYLTPGKLLYVDNRFALHSRDEFCATYDENGAPYRWVQRLFVAPNLWNFRTISSIGERVFNPAIPNNFVE